MKNQWVQEVIQTQENLVKVIENPAVKVLDVKDLLVKDLLVKVPVVKVPVTRVPAAKVQKWMIWVESLRWVWITWAADL